MEDLVMEILPGTHHLATAMTVGKKQVCYMTARSCQCYGFCNYRRLISSKNCRGCSPSVVLKLLLRQVHIKSVLKHGIFSL